MRESTRSAAGLAFWGLVLVAFDLNLGRLDVLSDPVGAVMCVAALGRLRAASPEDDPDTWRASRAWWVATALVVGVSQFAVLVGVVPPDTSTVNLASARHQVRPTAILSLLELVVLPAQFALIARFAAVAWSPRLVTSWATSRRWLLVVGVPVTLAAAVIDVSLLVTGRWVAVSLDSGVASLGLIAVLVGLAASLHVLVSLHRTRTAPDLERLPV